MNAGGGARVATLDIIDACPAKCLFCYNSANRSRNSRMTFSRFKRIIEASPLLERVEIGGGEPLLHNELRKMVGFCLNRRIEVDISTSGLVWKDEVLALPAAELKRLTVQVNVPAVDENAFRAVARCAGNFATVRESIGRFLNRLGSEAVRLKMTLCRENFGQLQKASALAAELEIPLIADLMIPVEGVAATQLDRNEIALARLAAAGLRMDGAPISFLESGAEKTKCPAVARAYRLTLIEGNCSAANGSKVYFDAGGNERRCEFLG